MTAVPMHPEPTTDPRTVRWVIPAGTLPLVGPVTDAPADLGTMLRSGTIAAIEVEPQAVLIRLAPDHAWATTGPRVRDALGTALGHPDQWRPATTPTEDDLLHAALQDVLNGPAGDYIRSHGGEATIVSAQDRRAEVRLSGTCTHCPAADFTLHSRLESELRKRFPALLELRATEQPGRRRPGPTWLSLRRRGA
ncbi:NifU family protein [Streptomyces sp. NEAU-sy36]|uniref:NifU family protein n=1 Tax=unclassified Streptomyces TaxID=2593676 RepID=UPI0015D5E2FD|nr:MULTISPECIES: NifU family protein [unclassified Streptomyces]QLJ04948.1 NifU family protein [Streptomyces sp. NEAU-sy36]